MAREAGNQRQVRPRDVFFTTDSIKVTFKRPYDRQRIDDVAMLIIDGELSPRAFPPISVVEYRQRLWALDNKRLWVFRKAEVSVITVKIVDCPDKVSLILTSALYNTFADPEYFPSVRDKVATRDKYEQPEVAAPPPPPSMPEKRKSSRPEKHMPDSTLPSYHQRSGYYSRKKFRAATLDHDGFLEGGRDDPSPVLKEKLPQRKTKNTLRSDMNHHHATEETGQGNHRSNGFKQAAPPFYTKNGKMPEITVLSDSSCGQNPIGATRVEDRRRKVSNARTNRYTTVSDEEMSYRQDNDRAYMDYLSDTTEYHGGGLHGIRPRKNHQWMTSTRPAHHKSTQQQMSKRGKIRETPVNPGLAKFRSYGKDVKPSSGRNEGRKGNAAYADFTTRRQHDRYEIPDHAAAPSKMGQAKLVASSEGEEGTNSRPRKLSDRNACRKDALPAKAHHVAGSDLEFQASPATTRECRDGTSARTRGFYRSREGQNAKESPAVVRGSREPLLTPELEDVGKGMPSAADPDTPESGKNANKLSNKSSVEPPDTYETSHGSKDAEHHPVLCSIACQTDDMLLEDPDEFVMLKSKKRKLSKSGEVRPSGGKVDEKRPKSAHTLKAKEVSEKDNHRDVSAGARKLISSDDESLVDCPIKVVTGADELERILSKSKLKRSHQGALRRGAQRPSDIGEPMGSKTPELQIPNLDKRGRSKGAGSDEIPRPPPSGRDASTVAPNMPNSTDPGHERGSTIPDIHKPITRSRRDAQVGAEARQSLSDNNYCPKDEERKKSTSYSNPPKETIAHAKKSKPESQMAKEVIAKKGRRGNDSVHTPVSTNLAVETRSAAAHRPVDKSPGGASQTDDKSQPDNADDQGLGLQPGDMVYVLVSAFHMGSGKPLSSLRRIGPFEFLKKTKNQHAAKLRVPADYAFFKDTVLMSSLTKKTEESHTSVSGIRTAVTVDTAPERVLLKRIVKPLRRRQKQELEHSYLVKWIHFPISEATWEPAEIFKENPGLPEDVDVPVLSNPFLLRNVRC